MNEDREQAKKQQDIVIRANLSRIGKIFLVMSGKGGVGKSSVAVNLAAAAADEGFHVGLMDVDLHGPSVPRMLGISGRLEIAEDRTITPRTHGDRLRVVSIESMLGDPDDPVIWRGPKKLQAIRQFISDVNWGALDYLFIDSPPGTGDEPLAVAQNVAGARAIVVTTPQEVSVADVRKAIRFLKKVGMETAGIVENMSGFTCPHCGRATPLFGKGGGKLLAEAMDLPFLGEIPLDPGVVEASDKGSPYVLAAPESEFSRVVRGIVHAL